MHCPAVMNCPSSRERLPNLPSQGASTTVYERFSRAISSAAVARWMAASVFSRRWDTSFTPERAASRWRLVASSFLKVASYSVVICSNWIGVAAFRLTKFSYRWRSFSSFASRISISAIDASYTDAVVCVVCKVAFITVAPACASFNAASASITRILYSRSSSTSKVSPLRTCWCSVK